MESKRPSWSPAASRISKTESCAGRGDAQVHAAPAVQISGTKTLPRSLRRSPSPPPTCPKQQLIGLLSCLVVVIIQSGMLKSPTIIGEVSNC